MCFFLSPAAINITRPRFGGSDEFGYTSFVAYPSVPSLSLFYEFKLKFTLADNSSAVRDNLMLFAGHKGQGELRSRRPRGNMKIILHGQMEKRETNLGMSPQLGLSCQTSLGILKRHAVAILRGFTPLCMVMCHLMDIHSPLRSFNQEDPQKDCLSWQILRHY